MPGFLLFLLLYLAALLVAGLPAALWAAPGRDDKDCPALLLAFPLGYLLINFAVFIASLATQSGTRDLARPVAGAVLAASAACLILLPGLRARAARLLRSQWRLLALVLLVVFPLSAFHILLPMFTKGWQYAYAISNDGATYLMLLEHIQDHHWTLGQIAKETLHLSYIGRPLFHYAQAITQSLSWLTPYQAYSLAGVVVAGLAALGLALCALRWFRPPRAALPLALSAAVFGLFGFYETLYYQRSYLPHYYSFFTLLFPLACLDLAQQRLRRFAILLVFMFGAIYVYTLGLAVILTCLLLAACGFRFLLGSPRSRQPIYDGLLALAAFALAALVALPTELPFFIGNLGRGFTGTVDLVEFWVRQTGLENEFVHIVRLPLVAGLALLGLLAYAATAALARARKDPTALGVLAGVATIVAAALVLNKYFFLNKFAVFMVPLLFAPLVAHMSPERTRAALARSLPALGIMGVFALSGFLTLQFFFIPKTVSTGTYITARMIADRDALYRDHAPTTCLAVDHNTERVLLVRQFFKKLRWQPACSLGSYEELRINPKHPPDWFSDYDYDVLFVSAGDRDPVDYSANAPYLLQDWEGLWSFYGPRASLVEFDLNWGLSTGPSGESVYFRRLDGGKGSVRFVNKGDNTRFDIRLRTLHDRVPVEDFPREAVHATVNGVEVPVGTDGLLRAGALLAPGVNLVEIAYTGVDPLEVTSVEFGR